MKLLLVEDNPLMQLLYKTVLKALRCEVDVVSNGEEALVLAKKQDYEIILLDIRLPNLNETLVKMRSLENNLKTRLIVLVTPREEGPIQECLPPGIEVLRKPIDIDELGSVVFRLNMANFISLARKISLKPSRFRGARPRPMKRS